MKNAQQYPHSLLVLFITFVVLTTISACSDMPVESTAPESTMSSSERELYQLLDHDAEAHRAMDLSALAEKTNFEALRAVLSNDNFETKAGKNGNHIVVNSGESIQTALDAAPEGAVIWIRPGTYLEALTITKPVTLMGWPGQNGTRVVIQNPGGVDNGITVRDADNVTIANLTVRDFDDNGIFTVRADGYLLLRVHAIDNGEYGLFPVRSNFGIIAFCSASGSADSGIYVGQSENVLVHHNDAFENVVGIEIENAVDVFVTDNRAYNNTAGMLGVLLPPSQFITFLEASDLYVAFNKFTGNNLANFADGGLVSAVPAGTGLLIVGYNETLVTHNQVKGNEFIGIGVGSTATFGAIAGIPISGIEPDPDEVHIVQNIVTDNGTGEPQLPGFAPADLLWDGTGTGNCWSKNKFNSSFPAPLPECQNPL